MLLYRRRVHFIQQKNPLVKPCKPLSAIRFFCFVFCFLVPLRGTENLHKSINLQFILLGTQRPLLTHTHKNKALLGLRHNKALACIPPARSWLLLRAMASRAREGCQPVRQTVLFLILLQKMGPLGPFLVTSRKHRPHHSIHLYTPRPDYISQRPLLIHTAHKNKALASDTTNP